MAHGLDLLRAKGRLPSSAASLAESSSLSMVISPGAFLYAFDPLELDGADMRREPIEVS